MMRSRSFLLVTLLIALAPDAYAADFVVTKEADTADGVCDADCSLREAIVAANQLPGADRVVVPDGTFAIAIEGRGENQGATGDFDITDPVVIEGANARDTIVDANGFDRVFHIRGSNGPVEIAHVTIRNGRTAAAFDHGGGVYVQDPRTMTLRSVDIHGCVVNGSGGGVFVGEGATATIEMAAVYSNRAEATPGAGGGGIYTGRDTVLVLTNATVDGNFGSEAGGLSLSGSATITNVAITNNESGSSIPGGIYVPFGATVIRNSILDGSINSSGAPSNCHPEASLLFSQGYNFERQQTCPLNGLGDSHADPLLAPRADNGGEVGMSRALLPGSPAINHAAENCPAVDQRGLPRPDVPCDSGAFEVQGPSPCTDFDADGFSPDGILCGPLDCDDANPSINPGRPEILGNAVDENCNFSTLCGTLVEPGRADSPWDFVAVMLSITVPLAAARRRVRRDRSSAF